MQSSKGGVEPQLYIIFTQKKRVIQEQILSNVIHLLSNVIYLDVMTIR